MINLVEGFSGSWRAGADGGVGAGGRNAEGAYSLWGASEAVSFLEETGVQMDQADASTRPLPVWNLAKGSSYICFWGPLGAHLKPEVREKIWKQENLEIFSLLPLERFIHHLSLQSMMGLRNHYLVFRTLLSTRLRVW